MIPNLSVLHPLNDLHLLFADLHEDTVFLDNCIDGKSCSVFF